MAITSTFYDTTPGNGITETQWAVNRFGGPSYGVAGANDWKVTAVAGQDRTVSIAAGKGFGFGVADVSDTNETRQLALVPSGTRWDLISAHRDWQPSGGGPTSFTVIQGISTPTIPAARVHDPGVEDDQPIALVEVIAGQTGVGRIIDLRCWASNGGLVAADLLARDYLATPGARVLIGNLEYRYLPDSTGSFAWEYREIMFREWNAQTGITTVGAGGTKSVSFPAGMFTVAPLVQATKQGAQSAKYVPYVTDITTSGCTVGLYSGDGTGATTTTTIAIRAVQTASNRATGVNP
jgi:hypothetical protein